MFTVPKGSLPLRVNLGIPIRTGEVEPTFKDEISISIQGKHSSTCDFTIALVMLATAGSISVTWH